MHRELFIDRAPGRQSSTESPGATGSPGDHSLVPGKRTLTEGLAVQRREAVAVPDTELAGTGAAAPAPAPLPCPASSGPRPTLQMLFGVQRAAIAARAEDPAHVHAAAARGTATSATRLPYADQIQRAFGRHDISGIQAHTGGDAAASAREMGARAYATGDHIVLGESADLHTVAHEAAHVVQQRGGVQLKGGVGEAGDPYERHADAVADLVVLGKSAEHLLDQPGIQGCGSAIDPVQRFRVHRGDGTPFRVDDLSGEQVRKYFVLAQHGHIEWESAEEAKALQARFRQLTGKKRDVPEPRSSQGPGLVPYGDDGSDDSEAEAPSKAPSKESEESPPTSPQPHKRAKEPAQQDEASAEDQPDVPRPLFSKETLRVQAQTVISGLRAYSTDDWNAARDALVRDLLSLQRFLTPPSDGPQRMWHDDDPLLEILSRGFQMLLASVESNAMMKATLTHQKALVVEGVSLGAMAPPRRTLLTFLAEAARQCAQATDGEMREWVERLRKVNE